MRIDYEVEYNNRARVPEHPQIFARWQRDGAAYREEAKAEGRAELGIRFGSTPRQYIDLFLPKGGAVNAPLALFIHGGYWRSLDPSMFSQLARGMNARGVAVAMSGYDLVPQVSIADIVAQTQAACLFLWKRFGKRFMVSGHSAGGHLAGCMLATDWAKLGAPADLVPAAHAISGLYDLAPLTHLAGNAEFKLTEASAKAISPLFWPAPKDKVFDAVVGGIESSEFLRQSRIVADAWAKANATRYQAIPGMNHFTVCDAMEDHVSRVQIRSAPVLRAKDVNMKGMFQTIPRETDVKRGDIVIVPFPFQDRLGEKIRPALVVQSNVENHRLVNTILAMITGNLDDAGQSTTVLVDPKTPDGTGSGLSGPSLVKCHNLATIRQKRVLHVIGQFPASLMSRIDLALKATLDLS